MKKLTDYITEAEQWVDSPSKGDDFGIELEDDTLLETYVSDVTEDGSIILESNDKIYSLLKEWNMLQDDYDTPSDEVEYEEELLQPTDSESDPHQDPGEYDQEGDMAKTDLQTIIRAARRLSGMLDDDENMPEWTQSKISKAADYVDTVADYIESNKEREDTVDEAKYQGREVPLSKPMRGDVKKFKVYVKDPKTGNVKKVNFGHGGSSAKRAGEKTMSIKKSDPARRKSFRARHNCDNPGPRTKARYWSCRAW